MVRLSSSSSSLLLLPSLLLLLTSSSFFLPTAHAQNFEGCTTLDIHKLTSVGRGMMGCFGLSLPEIFMFMGGMSPDQKAWLDKCSESSDAHQSDCFQLLESFLQQAASQPGSVPAKIVGNVYYNPPQVLNCAANIDKTLTSPFSPTCHDGVMLAQITHASARLAPYINSIQPWHLPPVFDGCAVSDLLNIQLAYLPFIDCLNLNFTQVVQGFSTTTVSTEGGAEARGQLEDTTIRAALHCLYDPHISNSECMYLIVLASTKLEGGSWSDMGIYAMRALTDYPQACQCVRGASQSAAYRAVPTTCAAQDSLNFLTALEASCAFEPQIQSSLSKALQGCSDADAVRAELVGVQLLDCMGASGGDLAGTTQMLDEGRIAQVANCANDPGYSNPDCLALLGSVAKVAAKQPDSLEGVMMERMMHDGEAFCACVDGAANSAPALGIEATCDVPYSGVTFLQKNQKYCEAIAAVPPGFWSAAAAGIAAAAKAPTSSSATSTSTASPEPTTPTTEVTLPPTQQEQLAQVEVHATAPKASSSSSWWWDEVDDYLPQMISMPDFTSVMSYFGGSSTVKDVPRRLVRDDDVGGSGGVEHPHLRFKGKANKQGNKSK